MITLNILPRCQNCPEFEPETHKDIFYGDDVAVEVSTQVICKHRGLCDRILEYLKNEEEAI